MTNRTVVDDATDLRARFIAQWAADAPVAVYDNQPNVTIDPSTAWCRFSVMPGVQARETTGSNAVYRQLGRVVLSIFVPAQEGTKGGLGYAAAFSSIFRDWRSSDLALRCYSPQTSLLGESNGWYQINVSIPYDSVARF